jgi:hypothetical protein
VRINITTRSVNLTKVAGIPESVIQWPNASAAATMIMMVQALWIPSVITSSVLPSKALVDEQADKERHDG